jgi:hypothetical protein
MSQYRKIIPFLLVILIGGGLWALLWHDPIEEGRCRLRRKATGDPSENPLVGLIRPALSPRSIAPNQMRGVSKNPKKWAAYRMTVAAEEVLMAMHISDKSTLLVDTNGNGLQYT